MLVDVCSIVLGSSRMFFCAWVPVMCTHFLCHKIATYSFVTFSLAIFQLVAFHGSVCFMKCRLPTKRV